MLKLLITSLFSLLIISGVSAQEALSYKQVDSLTLAYFNNGDWNELEAVGEKAVKSGIDYFYLNLRIGFAKFKLHKYYEADKYYRKAEKSFPNNKYLKEYMFWNYIWMDDYWLADGGYEDFSEEEKELILYDTKDPLAFMYAEGGIKLSDNSDSLGNISYLGFGIYHKFSTKFALYHKVNFLTQESYKGTFNQFEYHFAPNYQISKRLRLTGRFNYIFNKFDFDFNPERRDTIIETPPLQSIVRNVYFISDFDGDVTAQTTFAQLGVNYSIGRFKLDIDGGVFIGKISNNYTVKSDTNTVITTSVFLPAPPTVTTINKMGSETRIENGVTDNTQLQLSFGVHYVLPLLNDRLTIASDLYYFNSDNDQLTIAPSIHFKASKKLEFSMRYLRKGLHYLAENGSSVTYNTNQIEREKISFTTSYKTQKNKKIYLTLQNEGIEDNINNVNYTSTNLFVGFKF